MEYFKQTVCITCDQSISWTNWSAMPDAEDSESRTGQCDCAVKAYIQVRPHLVDVARLLSTLADETNRRYAGA